MRDGQLRQSQVITTYGPGALIDLPQHAAIMGGLDTWPRGLDEIVEPRLTQVLSNLTSVPSPKLYAPPPAPDEPWARQRASAPGAFRSGLSSKTMQLVIATALGVSYTAGRSTNVAVSMARASCRLALSAPVPGAMWMTSTG